MGQIYFGDQAGKWVRIKSTLTTIRTSGREDRFECPHPTDDSRHLMTLKEFCWQAAISRSSAFQHIQRGDLKVIKIGRTTRISGAAANEWLAKFM